MVNLSSEGKPMWQTKGVAMTRNESSGSQVRLEELMSKDQELLKNLVQEALQETLEAQMSECLGAQPHERSAGRVGYRSGHYTRGLLTRVGKIELRVAQGRQGRFSTGISAARNRLWPPWRVA